MQTNDKPQVITDNKALAAKWKRKQSMIITKSKSKYHKQ